MSLPYVGVVVPAYNEESRLSKTLTRLKEYLDSTGWDWRVLVVSDGSEDRTVAIATEHSQRDPRITVTHYTPNRGKGCAVRTGMLELEAEWLLLCDADLATPIEEVETLLGLGVPIAIGSRALDRTRITHRQPWWREFAGRAFNAVLRMLALPDLKDTQCGFKLFSGEAAKRVFSLCKMNGFSYDFEALMIARSLGYRIAEVPVAWSHQEGSKVSLIRDGIRMLWDLVKLRVSLPGRIRAARQGNS
ncbi:glycosyltransferase family 2 protein [Fimbriimonadia bacterium ATM]|nr:MAG: glycosyltransferase family 2 protein [Armatimonadota bacterium]MBC6969508.1 glycosyltransferase family 2 protein [Armatimonadota bacterium]MCE7899154.1 glycosyltransferase family 2 protein [Armatimonadetes bacterium ATM1]MDL1929436.1 glycosyltransferase family 2 protein [Fimbriimonadia bacterium ATM]RIJ97221.1 MAG: glycosyl transferase [Armatimonadota bacterium]